MLVGAVCAVLSCYLVLKGWSLMGDAGLACVCCRASCSPMWLGLPLALGAFAPAFSVRSLTGYLKENSWVKEDTVMGIVFSGMFGLRPGASSPSSIPTSTSCTSCSATCWA